jgi:ParB-like chromosome segregation protein Spo0J
MPAETASQPMLPRSDKQEKPFALNRAFCDDLSESSLIIFSRQNPSGVVYLVAGAHRLEAAKRLGWKLIAVVYVGGDDIERELQEIAENLHRAELTALERSNQIARWAELIAAKGAQVAPPSGGHQPRERGIKKVARDLGVERTEVQRAVKVASISEEAKQAAREAGLDDNRTALLTVARETTPEAQVAKVAEIAEEKTKSAAARQRLGRDKRNSELQREREAFLLRADEARDWAFYIGKVDAGVIESAKATAGAWCALVEKLEQGAKCDADKTIAASDQPRAIPPTAPVTSTPTLWERLDIPAYLDRRASSPG